MKAIVNVNKKSAYAKYNGLCFNVVDVLSQQISLSIFDHERHPTPITVDFGHSEVFVVDIRQEVNQAKLDLESKRSRNQFGNREQLTLDNLHSYCKKNKIQL